MVRNWKKAREYLLGTVPAAGGVDLEEIAIRRTWAQHEQAFEQNILLQMAVLYEDWTLRFAADVEPSLKIGRAHV